MNSAQLLNEAHRITGAPQSLEDSREIVAIYQRQESEWAMQQARATRSAKRDFVITLAATVALITVFVVKIAL